MREKRCFHKTKMKYTAKEYKPNLAVPDLCTSNSLPILCPVFTPVLVQILITAIYAGFILYSVSISSQKFFYCSYPGCIIIKETTYMLIIVQLCPMLWRDSPPPSFVSGNT